MRDVAVDIVSTDRIPEMRAMGTVAILDTAEGPIRKQADLKIPGAWSVEELKATREAADSDIMSGAYTRINVHTFTAFKYW